MPNINNWKTIYTCYTNEDTVKLREEYDLYLIGVNKEFDIFNWDAKIQSEQHVCTNNPDLSYSIAFENIGKCLATGQGGD